MNKKNRSTKSKKWRHARTSVEIAWTNEQKADLKWLWRHMVVTKIHKCHKKRKQKMLAQLADCQKIAAISFVDLHSQKSKKDSKKIRLFIDG